MVSIEKLPSYGLIVQLGERYTGSVEVRDSSSRRSTIFGKLHLFFGVMQMSSVETVLIRHRQQ